MKAVYKALRENKSLVLFVFLLLMFRGAIADWHPVPTGSMKPTILEGDVVIQNKLAYDLKVPFTDIKLAALSDPQRGDIVVINSNVADKRLIKRIVGMPGDQITVIQNRLIINGEPMAYTLANPDALDRIRISDKEPGVYAVEQLTDGVPHLMHSRQYSNHAGRYLQVEVPADHYFMMGDSRDNSADSRYYGAFPRHEIRGRATHTLVSLNMLDSYKPRWERFFARLQ